MQVLKARDRSKTHLLTCVCQFSFKLKQAFKSRKDAPNSSNFSAARADDDGSDLGAALRCCFDKRHGNSTRAIKADIGCEIKFCNAREGKSYLDLYENSSFNISNPVMIFKF